MFKGFFESFEGIKTPIAHDLINLSVEKLI